MLVWCLVTVAMAHGPAVGEGVTVPVDPATFVEVARAHALPGATRLEVAQVGATPVRALTQSTATGLWLTLLDGAGEVVVQELLLEPVRWSCTVCTEPGAWEGVASVPGGELRLVLSEGEIRTTRIGHPLALATQPTP